MLGHRSPNYHTSVHNQVEGCAILMQELQVSTRRLSCATTEQDELRRISASVDKMRKQKFRSSCRAAFVGYRQRGNQEVRGRLTFVVPAAQAHHGKARRSSGDPQDALKRKCEAGEELMQKCRCLTVTRHR